MKFEELQYQVDAIDSIVDLFKDCEGQTIRDSWKDLLSVYRNNFANINCDELILNNLQEVQKNNELSESTKLRPDKNYDFNNFSVEMETGTGKTYVYLRTILELNRRYNFTKFILVVPSIAIREGVLQSLRSMSEHFKEKYNKGIHFFDYSADATARIKEFAESNILQLMIINIQSFNKDKNVIKRVEDTIEMNGYTRLDWIQSVRAIVILDEPQSIDTTGKSRDSIQALCPLFCIRYSATHKDLYNCVYKLDHRQAGEQNLIKQISFYGISSDEGVVKSNAYIKLVGVNSVKNTIQAKVEVRYFLDGKIATKIVTVRSGDDVYQITAKCIDYDGFVVKNISKENIGKVEFTNGITLITGDVTGKIDNEILKEQIRGTLRAHFEHEKQLKSNNISMKVLSLFFVDKVANFRGENGERGKFANMFNEIYEEFRNDASYSELTFLPVKEVVGSYFAQDRNKKFVDIDETSAKDQDKRKSGYELIMKDKERLLSLSEPVKFIFSHSALKEGWDNPNVFQICCLREIGTEQQRRQIIGRGMRLPVYADGTRCQDMNINRLQVCSPEPCERFIAGLQKEYEATNNASPDIRNARKQLPQNKYHKEIEDNEYFQNLWHRINWLTRFAVSFEIDSFKQEIARRIQSSIETIEPLKVRKVAIDAAWGSQILAESKLDINRKFTEKTLEKLQQATGITKCTLVDILIKHIDNAEEKYSYRPDTFLEIVCREVKLLLSEYAAKQPNGINYERINDDCYSIDLFKIAPQIATQDVDKIKDTFGTSKDKTPYDYIVTTSEIEADMLMRLKNSAMIKFFCKLPGWFKIPTPIGGFNPDWAYVKKNNDNVVYFVRETKGGYGSLSELSPKEQQKIKFGRKHFSALKTNVQFSECLDSDIDNI